MMDLVSFKCGPYRLMIPSRNVESIRLLDEQVHPTRISRLRRNERPHPGNPYRCPVLDLRPLLGVSSTPSVSTRIQLDWVSTDAERRAVLLADAVEEIVASQMTHIERVPFLPKRLTGLCEGVMRDSDATYRLCLKLDAQWPSRSMSDLRAWRRALVTVGSLSASNHPSPPDSSKSAMDQAQSLSL
jgi:hypothetical protein